MVFRSLSAQAFEFLSVTFDFKASGSGAAEDRQMPRSALRGIGDSAFLGEYFGRKPLVLRSNFEALAEAGPMYELFESALHQGDIRIVDRYRGGSGYSVEHAASQIGVSKLDSEGIRKLLTESPYSVIVERFSHYSQPAAELQWVVADLLGARVATVCLATPPRSKATSVHYDPGDAFVVQLYGSKVWMLSRPIVETPIPDEPALTLDAVKRHRLDVYSRVRLEPGDFLYVPRGWMHEVTNDEDKISIHTTSLAYINTTYTMIDSLIDHVMRQEHTAGRLNTQLLHENVNRRDTREILLSLAERISNRVNSEIKTGDLARYLRNVPNGKSQLENIRSARQSASGIERGLDDNLILRRNEVDVAAIYDAEKQSYIVTTDGENTTSIYSTIWEKIESITETRIRELRKRLNVKSKDFDELLITLICELGLFTVQKGL